MPVSLGVATLNAAEKEKRGDLEVKVERERRGNEYVIIFECSAVALAVKWVVV